LKVILVSGRGRGFDLEGTPTSRSRVGAKCSSRRGKPEWRNRREHRKCDPRTEAGSRREVWVDQQQVRQSVV